jgi:hypothetical protein
VWARDEAKHYLWTIVPGPPAAASGPLFGVAVQRYRSLSDAHRVSPPQMRALLDDLNGSGRHRIVISRPAPSDAPPPVYGFVIRSGFEKEFSELSTRGLDRLSIYEVYIPQSWRDEELDYHLYQWADWCRVQRDWILHWSEFKGNWGFRENKCHQGGWCVIVSESCDTRIYSV